MNWDQTPLSGALEMARRGYRVFPLLGVVERDGQLLDEETMEPAHQSSGKRPRVRWQDEATTDVRKVEEWAGRWPHSNFGVALQQGQMVVDCDTEEDAEYFADHFWEIEAHERLRRGDDDELDAPMGMRQLDTLAVKTARGVHFYLAGTTRNGKWHDNVDRKSVGGYVVCPGSRTWDGGRYTVVDDSPVQAAPSWCVDARADRKREPQADGQGELMLGPGERNTGLARVAGQLRAMGLSVDLCREVVYQVNRVHTVEPLRDEELQETVFKSLGQWAPGTLVEDMVAAEHVLGDVGEPEEPDRFLMMESDRRSKRPPRWLYEGVLPDTGVAQLYGASGSGKTFVAIDLALSVSNGLDWGSRSWTGPREQSWVLYVLGEGSWDFQRRLDAWVDSNPGCTAGRVLTVEERDLNLADPVDWRRLGQELVSDERLVGVADKIGLVVLDTQSMLLHVDENDNRKASEAMSVLKRVSKRLRCPVLLVHHKGVAGDGRARGASAWHAAVDLQVELTKTMEGMGSIKFKKVKAAPCPEDEMPFTLEQPDAPESAQPSVRVVWKTAEAIELRKVVLDAKRHEPEVLQALAYLHEAPSHEATWPTMARDLWGRATPASYSRPRWIGVRDAIARHPEIDYTPPQATAPNSPAVFRLSST